MGFFSKLFDKTKELFGGNKDAKPEIERENSLNSSLEEQKEIIVPHDIDTYSSNSIVVEDTDAKKIINDFKLKHPGACELFQNEITRIEQEADNLDLLLEYLHKCNYKVDLYSNSIKDIFIITHIRSLISVKLRPEVIFMVQGAVQDHIDLIKDLIPYVIKLFIYDCKKIIFNILEFFHICKKDIEISPKSIADDFVNKMATGITQRIREIFASHFSKDDIHLELVNDTPCKELKEIVRISDKYKDICSEIKEIRFSLDDIVGDEYRVDLSNHIDRVISRYENRHIVDKIKDYIIILWYVLRFFYSIFFGAGFLYIIWLGKNLDSWWTNIDAFFLKAGNIMDYNGTESASELIAPMVAAAVSKITLILIVLGAAVVLVYFGYRLNSVRNKLSDIVNLNISMYAASLLDISVYKSTDNLIRDIRLGIQILLEVPGSALLQASDSPKEDFSGRVVDDRAVALYIERVKELRVLCERLMACARKKQK